MPGQGVSKLQKNSPADASTGVIFISPARVNLISPKGVSLACPKGSNSRAFSKVTRDKEIGQGNGLFGLHSIVVQGEGRLVITSGGALFNLFEGKIKTGRNLPVLTREQTSTTIDFQLDYSKKLSIDKALKFKGEPYNLTSLRIENLENENGVIHYKIAEQGDGTGTRMAAEKIKNELLNILTEEVRPIILDFSGITVISSSFADELIAKLLSKLGLYQFNKIFRLEGLNDSQQLILHRSVLQRLAQEYQKITSTSSKNQK